ncbi:IS5 family transposase [Streptomyces sp. NPDC048560]|uniref:IS5 family transposase n=1 Tax=Streptomyces sp. NPDC048560 TaxID=3155488 RepID=UPI00342D5B44
MSLTDARWARIEPLLPDRTPRRGGRWRDHREVIDSIAFKFRTGTQWVHLPEKYGNWRGVYNRLRMWAVDGTWERVFTALVAQADADDSLNWAVSVDSTIVRAHQHAAGARKGAPIGEPADSQHLRQRRVVDRGDGEDGRLRAPAGGHGRRRFAGEHPPPRRQRDPIDPGGGLRDARAGEVPLDRRGVRRGRGGQGHHPGRAATDVRPAPDYCGTTLTSHQAVGV